MQSMAHSTQVISVRGGNSHDPEQGKGAAKTAQLNQQQTAPGKQQNHACPGTNQNKLDCDAVTAVATVRQADTAAVFNKLAYVEIGVGLVTSLIAFLAAKFARDAAAAARDANRPWLAVEVAVKALTISAEVVSLPIEVTVANYGKSPASHVMAFAHLHIIDHDGDFPLYVSRDTVNALIKKWKGGVTEFGCTVFPSKPEIFEEVAYSAPGAIKKARADPKARNVVAVVGVRYTYLRRDRFTAESITIVPLHENQRTLGSNVTLQSNEYSSVEHPNSYMT